MIFKILFVLVAVCAIRIDGSGESVNIIIITIMYT